MAIYKIYAPPLFRASLINADSDQDARKLSGAGLSETDKALIVAHELKDASQAMMVGQKVAA
jgi:hypothetical protein